MVEQNNNFNSLILEAKEQIESEQYLEAINNLNYIIENHTRDGYAFFLRGKAYTQLKRYKPALSDYETALEIYQEADDKEYQIYTLIKLAFVYPFNGKVREGFLAQQQSIRLAKELNISEDDPLYSYVSVFSQWSDESIDRMESSLQNVKSIPSWDKFGLMGKMMGYATKGKFQGYLFIIVWLLMAIPALALAILSSPFWISATIYQRWKRNRNSE